MSKLFEDMLKDEDYKKLYDQIDEKDRKDLMEAMRTLVNDFEEKILNPIKKQIDNIEAPQKTDKT